LAGGMEGAEVRLTSDSGEERLVLRFVPGEGDDPSAEPTPSCVKGFATAGDGFPDAGVILILVRLTADGSSLAPSDEAGAAGLSDAGCDAWPPSSVFAGGAFVDPSFSRRRRRICYDVSSVSNQYGLGLYPRHRERSQWIDGVARTCSIFSGSGASGMLGGCSFGSIFANLCGGTSEQELRFQARRGCRRWPLNHQSERRADKYRQAVGCVLCTCLGTLMPACPPACRALGNDGRHRGSVWKCTYYVSSFGNR
jgi:hypothetical protein